MPGNQLDASDAVNERASSTPRCPSLRGSAGRGCRATAHEGTIRVESRLGEGSTFIVELPARLPPSNGRMSTTSPESHPDPSGRASGGGASLDFAVDLTR